VAGLAWLAALGCSLVGEKILTMIDLYAPACENEEDKTYVTLAFFPVKPYPTRNNTIFREQEKRNITTHP
jgi:hypothetical protein